MSNFWKKFFFSPFILKATRARKIAYISMMVALSIVGNMFFEFKLGAVQYSFTTVISALIGILIGPIAGLCACFIGDGVGFIANPSGAYTPWIGLATGLIAFISGAFVHLIKNEKAGTVYVKIAVISVLTFFICSVGINSTFLWFLLRKLEMFSKMTYSEFLIYRYIVSGQLFVSVINYALLFALVAVLKRLSFFKELQLGPSFKKEIDKPENVEQG